ncbi:MULTISPECIES: hypothetical protein [unclassified Microcoleus]|uniref:hypothetical protein n=1 Tax=unclassified Microcoleus TaxID=2642155 RepID=UPI002FCFA015
MPTGKPKIGVVYRSAGRPLDPPRCIPAKAYEKKYFVSRFQIKRLLAKKLLCGVQFKRRLFIEDVPPPLK